MSVTTKTPYFYAIHTNAPSSTQTVHVFDIDDTLTLKPDNFVNLGLTANEYFDAAHHFDADAEVAGMLHMLHSLGDHIAVCTSRPVQRLRQSYEWLQRNGLPFDVLIASTGQDTSSSTKQRMFQMLFDQYADIGTVVDDSPYNIQGAMLHGINCVHVRKNDEYWATHPEEVVLIKSQY